MEGLDVTDLNSMATEDVCQRRAVDEFHFVLTQ
jgi:hypothetical protein